MSKPPVNMWKIITGNAAFAGDEADIYPAVVSVIETYPQIVGFDLEVYEYFKEQWVLY